MTEIIKKKISDDSITELTDFSGGFKVLGTTNDNKSAKIDLKVIDEFQKTIEQNASDISQLKGEVGVSVSWQIGEANYLTGGFSYSESGNRLLSSAIEASEIQAITCETQFYVLGYTSSSPSTATFVASYSSNPFVTSADIAQFVEDNPTIIYIALVLATTDTSIGDTVVFTYTNVSVTSRLSAAEVDLVANASSISENASSILTNTSAIEQNASDISQLKGEVGVSVSWQIGEANYLTGGFSYSESGNRLLSSAIEASEIQAITCETQFYVLGYTSSSPSTATFVASYSSNPFVTSADIAQFVEDNPTIIYIALVLATTDTSIGDTVVFTYTNVSVTSRLSAAEVDLVANASSISENASSILTNTSAIEQNASDILSLQKGDNYGSRTIVTVKKDGTGSFLTLVEAAEYAYSNASRQNLVEIQVYDDFKIETDEYTADAFTHLCLLPVYDYVKVIGMNGRRKLFAGLPNTGFTQTERALRQTLYIWPGAVVEGIHAVASGTRYAVHFETGGSSSSSRINKTTKLINCIFEHLGGEDVAVEDKWYQPDAWGSGISSGNKFEFISCKFVSQTFPFRQHTNHDFENATRTKFISCQFINTKDKISTYKNGVSSTNGGCSIYIDELGSKQKRYFEFYNCSFKSIRCSSSFYNNTSVGKVLPVPAITGGGNTPFYYRTYKNGTSIKISSLTTGEASSVILVQDDANLIGNVVEISGSVELAGYLYGDEELNDELSLNRINTRLGDCSAENKLLIVSIDGDERTVTFNEDFTDLTVDYCFTFIETQLSSWATVSKYYHYPNYYPEFNDVLFNLRNETDSPILKGEFARIVDGNKCVPASENYTGEVMMAIEDVPVGGYGRLIRNCYVANDNIFQPLYLSATPEFSEGDLFRISSTSSLVKCGTDEEQYGNIVAISDELLFIK